MAMLEQESLPIAAAREGRPEAWDALFRRYQMPLYAYVCELTGDGEASLDIVQETFISAARHVGSLRADHKFGSWLFGIAHQKCLQRWRRLRPDSIPLEEVEASEPAADPDPSEWLIRREQEEAFLTGVSQLTPAHRAVLLLHYLEDFPLEDIAAVTNTGVGTVKSRLHYAKRALRQRLERES